MGKRAKDLRGVLLFAMAILLYIPVEAGLNIPFKAIEEPEMQRLSHQEEIAMRDQDSSSRERNTRDNRLQRQYFENRRYNSSNIPYPVYGPPLNGTTNYYFYYSRPRDFYGSGDNGGIYFYPRQYPVQ